MPRSNNLSKKSAAVLSKFPGPVVLRSSKLKWGFFAISAAIFAILGLLVACMGLRDKTIGERLGGLVWSIPWALMSGKIFLRLIAGSMRLVLDLDGFYARSLWGDGRRFHWSTTAQFVPTRVGAINTIAFDDSTKKDGFWTRSDRALQGGNTRLGDDFGMDTSDFARLMNAWREKALKQV